MISRREVMKSSAIAVPAVAVGACTQTPNGIQLNPTVLDNIMAEVAQGCNFIPAVTSVIALVTTSFPALVGAGTITDAVLAEIKAVFCANVPAPSNPVSSLKMKSGATVAVAAHGWVIVNGKLTYV